MNRLLSLALLAVVASCTVQDPGLEDMMIGGDELALEVPSSDRQTCGSQCGRNSSRVNDGLLAHGVDGRYLHPEVNEDGIAIEYMRGPSGTTLLMPVVLRDRLYAVHWTWARQHAQLHDQDPAEFVSQARDAGVLVEHSADLVRSTIGVTRRGAAELERFVLEIRAISARPYLRPLTGTTTKYDLWVRPAGMPSAVAERVCAPDSSPGGAFLFAGDRYDLDAITVRDSEHWINVACSDTAAGKLHSIRQTRGSTPLGEDPSPWYDRQALLKMITADYCGTGTSHTEDGVPLHWSDGMGRYSNVGDDDVLEARWSFRGARCLETPRLPERAQEIANDCRRELPACDTVAPGGVQSAIPAE